jgi:RNA polymerase sigma factor (TIGR02999 family)
LAPLAFILLVGAEKAQHWNGRGHFFGAAAEAMRRILVDSARRKAGERHGGNLERVELNEGQLAAAGRSIDLIALDEALERLAERDPRKAELVKLRFFAGLTIRQAADALGISDSTADADWAYAKSWLRLQMAD